ncbi:MAG TPA: hypothetical protein VF543_18845 [Pyrinomonadaceae bacterium]
MTVEEWAVKIAEEVSPVETDFAPLWAEAFVKGGKDRQELFTRSNAQASAFLPGDFIPMLPVILKALAFAAPTLIAVLTSEFTGKFLDVVKNGLAFGEVVGKGKALLSEEPHAGAKPPAAPEAVYEKLNEIMTKLDKEVRALGLNKTKRDRINLIVLRLLLENPPDATRFINQLTKSK